MSVWAASLEPTSKHWTASSLVGTRMRHRVVAACFPLSRYKRRSSKGMVKAAVLPEPVTAFPTTSLPNRATGIVAAWIGVGETNPRVVKAFWMGRDRFSVKKEVWLSWGTSESKKAALRSFSACVSAPEPSDKSLSSSLADCSESDSSDSSSDVASGSSSSSSSSDAPAC
jgi:hypothetical protein